MPAEHRFPRFRLHQGKPDTLEGSGNDRLRSLKEKDDAEDDFRRIEELYPQFAGTVSV